MSRSASEKLTLDVDLSWKDAQGLPSLTRETRMQNIHALLRRAAMQVRDGVLPGTVPTDYLGGEGNGEACVVCQQRIDRSDVLIAISRPRGKSAHFHFVCYRAYARACEAASEKDGSRSKDR